MIIGIKRRFTPAKDLELSTIKKRKINFSTFEEIKIKTSLKASVYGDKEEGDVTVSEILSHMEKLEIKKKKAICELGFTKKETPNVSYCVKNKIVTMRDENPEIKAKLAKFNNFNNNNNFAYSNLKTELRCNFKKSFEVSGGITNNLNKDKSPSNASRDKIKSNNKSFEKPPGYSLGKAVPKFQFYTEEKKRSRSFISSVKEKNENQTPKFPQGVKNVPDSNINPSNNIKITLLQTAKIHKTEILKKR
jgi:hypothetical protein